MGGEGGGGGTSHPKGQPEAPPPRATPRASHTVRAKRVRVRHASEGPPKAGGGYIEGRAPMSANGQVLALRAHCVHTAHAEAGILTQEYLSPV